MNLSEYNIILASNSPRRKELLSGLDIDYSIKVLPDIDESYPSDIRKEDVGKYISKQKADAYISQLGENDLLITADTIVLLEDEVLGKPENEAEATQMLQKLSGKVHRVITGVTIATKEKQHTFDVVSEVTFSELEASEIEYYVNKYKPFDKAGGYGIQEWIGYVAVENISGSYFNIVGLPVQRLYQELKRLGFVSNTSSTHV